MKLDRNLSSRHRGKYALIRLRVDEPIIPLFTPDRATVSRHAIDYGNTEDSEFFVIRLKDKYAAPALHAYAEAARQDDPEWADEVAALASKALNHPSKRKPD